MPPFFNSLDNTMPGQTNNENHLAAYNQIIVALNELKSILESGDQDPATLGELLELAADNVESLRTTLEARSVAETTAQNTNFAGLIAALQALNFVCSPRVSMTNYLVPDIPPAAPGTEFDTPPPPFTQTEQEPGTTPYYERKCVLATTMHDAIREAIAYWDSWYLDEAFNISFNFFLIQLMAAFFEIATLPSLLISIFGGTAGRLTTLAVGIYQNLGSIEFSEMLPVLDNNRDDLICALYNASDAPTARGDYNTILENAGMSVIHRGIIANLLPDDYLNHLFFKRDADVEAEWPLYAEGADCSGCGGEIYFFDFPNDEEGWIFNVVDEGGGTPIGFHEPDNLRVSITKSSSNNSISEWQYNPVGWGNVKTGSSFRVRLKNYPPNATGIRLFVRFTDATSQVVYMDTAIWGNQYKDATLNVASEHSGKTIQQIAVECHSGPAAGFGTGEFYIDEVEVII